MTAVIYARYSSDSQREASIETDATASALTFYNIGLETLTIVVVHYLNLLARYQPCGIHQVFIYRDAAHIVEVGLCHRHTMELSLQYFYLHNIGLFNNRLSFISDMVDETDRSLTTIYCDTTHYVVARFP